MSFTAPPYYLLAAAGAGGVVSIGSMLLSESNNIRFQPKKAIMFSLLFVGLIGLGGFTSKLSIHPMPLYIIDQAYFLILGCFYTFFFYKNYSLQLKRLILSESLALIGTVVIGLIPFYILFNIFGILHLGKIFCTSALTFFLPFLYRETFLSFFRIPKPIYKVWKFPKEYYEPDLDKLDLNSQILSEIEIRKNLADSFTSNLKLKAPLEMVLSDWFFLSLQEYNFRQPEKPIEINNESEDTYEWQFYVKPTFFNGRRFLDPDISIRGNKIKENNIIIAERVLKV